MHTNRQLQSGPMLLTFSEAAREAGLSLGTIRALIKSGKLTVVLLDTGKTMAPTKRIRRADLVEYVENLRTAS